MSGLSGQWRAVPVKPKKFGTEWVICLCLVMVTLFTYWQVRHHDFVDFDDDIYVTSNSHVQAGWTLDGLKWSLDIKNDNQTYWHPLTWLSLMTDVQIFGVDAGGSLTVNVVLHVLNSLLLFYFFRRWSANIWPSIFIAIFFALHPIGVESVAWVASRKTLLSSLFWILTLLAYGRYADRPSLGRYSVVIICLVLGLMAKPMLVTLPLVLLLMDIWPLKRISIGGIARETRTAIRLLAEKLPLFLLSILSVSLSMLSLHGNYFYSPYSAIPMNMRIGNALVSYLAYIGKFFWPLELSVFYPFPGQIPLWKPVIASFAITGVTIAVWQFGRRKPYLIVGWVWYVVTLTPVIGLLQAGLWPAMADRFAYIPFIGLYIIIGFGCFEAFSGRLDSRICCLLAASMIIILAARTWQQVAYWENSVTLFKHAIEVDEGNYIAHNNIGKSLRDIGQLDEAAKHYKMALNIYPKYVSAHVNLGAALALQGKTEAAVKHLTEALRINPYQADAHYVLGNILAEKKDLLNVAIQHYEKAIDINPDYLEAHNNLANILAEKGNLDEAVVHYRRVLEINPRYAKAYNNLGSALYRSDQLNEAVYNYYRAIDFQHDYAEAHNNLGVALKRQGLMEKAVFHYQKALLLKPDYSEAQFNLGLALVHIGEIEKATFHFEEALKIKPTDLQIKYHLEKTLKKLEAINSEIDAMKKLAASEKANPGYQTQLGDLFKKKGDSRSAAEHYRMALVQDDQYIPALKKLGFIHAGEGQFDDALTLFFRISQLETTNAEACYWIAGIYAIQKQTEKSVMWLERAVERGYSEWAQIKRDPKFRNIRHTEYFKKLIKRSK